MRFRLLCVAACLSALAAASPASALLLDFTGPPAYQGLAKKAKREKQAAATFALPLRGPVHSRFGYRWGRLHAGVDIAVLRTDRVVAARSGVVTGVGYLRSYGGYGNVVRIRHGGGVATLYAHLASFRVRAGRRVERGQPIGRAGCTGSCTGPHLHFEVRVRGKPVDPLPFLKKALRYNRRDRGG